MGIITIFLFALGLCFDSFAVSISCGISRCSFTRSQAFRFAAVLAFCQGLMPLIGWFLASEFLSTIHSFDHWIAFILLTLIGGKMIKESFSCDCEEEGSTKGSPFALRNSLIMGIATSIDALIAGVAMAMVPITISRESSQLTNMFIAVGIIALVTFVASAVGLFLGNRSRSKLGCRSELIGGLILIAIGTKILIEHLCE